MSVQYSKWRPNNDGQYVNIEIGHTEPIVIDLQNELEAGDFLQGCIATTTSGTMTINTATVRTDISAGFEYPHQQLVRLTPQAVGTHHIKAVSTTQNGLIIVKHFDVRTDR